MQEIQVIVIKKYQFTLRRNFEMGFQGDDKFKSSKVTRKPTSQIAILLLNCSFIYHIHLCLLIYRNTSVFGMK